MYVIILLNFLIIGFHVLKKSENNPCHFQNSVFKYIFLHRFTDASRFWTVFGFKQIIFHGLYLKKS